MYHVFVFRFGEWQFYTIAVDRDDLRICLNWFRSCGIAAEYFAW